MNEYINGVSASIVFLIAIVGIIVITIIKKRKSNSEYTISDFIDENYNKLVNVLATVVNLLMVNVNDYPDKESYERDIIRLTVEKLYNNCDEFGIESALIKMVNKDALTNVLYDLLHKEEVKVFANNVPVSVIEDNAQLYDAKVLEAVGIGSVVATKSAEEYVDTAVEHVIAEVDDESIEEKFAEESASAKCVYTTADEAVDSEDNVADSVVAESAYSSAIEAADDYSAPYSMDE